MKKGKVSKNIIRWLPGIVISLIISYFVFRLVDFQSLVDSISKIGSMNILIIAILTIISIAARAVAWMCFLPKVNFFDSFLLINGSYLFNNLIPRSGEIVKAILYSKPASESPMKILSSVVIERSLDLMIAATMFLATFPFIAQLESIRPIAIGLLILFLIFLALCFFVVLNSEKVIMWLRQVGKNNSFYQEKLLPRIALVIDGFEVLTNWKQFTAVFFWIAVSWSLWTLILFFGINLIQNEAKIWWAVFTEGVLALGIALPSAPAGIGVYEGTMVAALSVFDIKLEDSLGIAVIIHLVQILTTSLIGLFAVLRQGESISAIIGRIRSTNQSNQQKDETE